MTSLREVLMKKLPKEEAEKAVTSFDIIGDIAIIEVPEELEHREKEIGEAILEVHKSVKTVCKRAGIHEGVYRIRPVKVIAGENRTVTEYRESGARIRLDVSKVYFTPRLSYERERIAKQVKPGEVIGYWFAGVGPFGLVILKRVPNVKIYAIELNPEAVKWMKENVRLNRVEGRMIPILGNVREEAEKIPEKMDRIIMPLPKTGEDFLDLAFRHVKKGGVIHFYYIGDRKDPFTRAEEIIRRKAEETGSKYRIAFKRVVRPFSPGKVQVVFDIVKEE